MKPPPVTEILELPVELRADLDRRLVEFEADPEAGLHWDEVRERILLGRWREVGRGDTP